MNKLCNFSSITNCCIKDNMYFVKPIQLPLVLPSSITMLLVHLTWDPIQLLFSSTSVRLLTLLITKCFFINYVTNLISVINPCNLSNPIWLIALNMWMFVKLIVSFSQFSLVCHRVLSLGHFCFCFTLMTCIYMFIILFCLCMLMMLLFSSLILTLTCLFHLWTAISNL